MNFFKEGIYERIFLNIFERKRKRANFLRIKHGCEQIQFSSECSEYYLLINP